MNAAGPPAPTTDSHTTTIVANQNDITKSLGLTDESRGELGARLTELTGRLVGVGVANEPNQRHCLHFVVSSTNHLAQTDFTVFFARRGRSELDFPGWCFCGTA